MIFLVLSTYTSQYFTTPSVESLVRHTKLESSDRIVVIDNDGSLDDIPGATVIRNGRPKSFAENANFGIALSHILKDDLMLLNNDIVYTNHWFDLLELDDEKIIVPFCNQDAQYEYDGLQIKFAMDFEDYGDNERQLNAIARLHAAKVANDPPYTREALISFYCVYIPWKISKVIGLFDETFGRGGGEDVDYRLRAMELGIDVVKAQRPFLLHFMGKSTWRSGEKKEATETANEIYRGHFVEKWGARVAEFFLAGADTQVIASRSGFNSALANSDFATILDHLRTNTP